jgi:hypothetical protein
MRRPTWVFVLALAGACSPIPMPKVPAVQTDAGRHCLQTCQGLYNQCMAGVGQQGVYWGGSPAGRMRNATNACRENLGGCYGTCPP